MDSGNEDYIEVHIRNRGSAVVNAPQKVAPEIHHSYARGLHLGVITQQTILDEIEFEIGLNFRRLVGVRYGANIFSRPDTALFSICARIHDPARFRKLVRTAKVVDQTTIAASQIRKSGGKVSAWDTVQIQQAVLGNNDTAVSVMSSILTEAGRAAVESGNLQEARAARKSLEDRITCIHDHTAFDAAGTRSGLDHIPILRWNGINGSGVTLLPALFSIGAHGVNLTLSGSVQ